MVIVQIIGWILLIILIGIGIFYLGFGAGAAKMAQGLVLFSKDELMELKENIDKVVDGTETMKDFKEKCNRLKQQRKNRLGK